MSNQRISVTSTNDATINFEIDLNGLNRQTIRLLELIEIAVSNPFLVKKTDHRNE